MRRYLMPFMMIVSLFVIGSCSRVSSETTDRVTSFKNHHMAAELYPFGNTIIFLTHYQDDGCKRFMYYDKDADICGLLCGKPECTHNTPQCNAIVGSNGASVYGIGILKSKIYWISDSIDGDEYKGKYLYRMNLDGTGREEVRQIISPDQRDQIITSNMSVDYTGDYMIIGGGRHDVDSGIDQPYLSLRAYSLTSHGEDQVLLDEINPGSLYFCSSGLDIYYSITSQKLQKEGEEWVQDSWLQLYKYSLQNQKTDLLFDSVVSFYPWEFSLDGEQVIFSTLSDQKSLNQAYVLDLSTQKISRSIPMEEELSGLGGGSNVDQGKIICYSYPSGDQSKTRIYVKNYSGEVVSDYVKDNIMMSADNRGRGRVFAGSDKEYLYYFFKDYIGDKEREWLLAYPIEEDNPKLIYTDADEDVVNENEKEEKSFSVKIVLDAEKIGNDYYIDSLDDLENTKCSLWIHNNTEHNLLDYIIRLFIISTYKWMIINANGEKFPAEISEDIVSGMPLSLFELYPTNFVDGKAVLRFECTGILDGKQICVSDEVTLYVRSEMD